MSDMDWRVVLQIAGVVLGLIYLYLEYRASVWLWVVGVLMPVVHATLYLRQGLYADFSMQLYYIVAGIYGLCVWLWYGERSTSTHEGLKIRPMPQRVWLWSVVAASVVFVVIYQLLSRFTDSNVPVWDALTTALSIVAMWLLSRKYVEQWLWWLLVDLLTVALYFYKDIPLTASLYVLYSLLAVVGYRRWLAVWRKSVGRGL